MSKNRFLDILINNMIIPEMQQFFYWAMSIKM